MLKKQTVWLLTMLSLMIVLSVYYMTSPDNEDIAYVDTGQDATTDDTEEASTENADSTDETDVGDISNLGRDEIFTSLRMDLQDERSAKKSRLEEIVASSNATTEEKNQAMKDIDEIEKMMTKETVIEDAVLANAEYQDVLVRNDGEVVHVHVMVDGKLSNEETVQIMRMVYDEFGEIRVNVITQPTTES
ncbi:SpoIIIAH-like family protein [Ornithinibacillus salinisoli]|uniref:SpoIIIAH-like family protein n=1 Tax=Ornithinibacillus salinisoli TaxID=1848459 RepID=A0ABW4W2E9_9BACI